MDKSHTAIAESHNCNENALFDGFFCFFFQHGIFATRAAIWYDDTHCVQRQRYSQLITSCGARFFFTYSRVVCALYTMYIDEG